jgi:hypothetical protein
MGERADIYEGNRVRVNTTFLSNFLIGEKEK